MKHLFILLSAALLAVLPATSQAADGQPTRLPNRISVAWGDAFYTTTAYGLLDALIGGPLFLNADEITSVGNFTLSYQRMSASGRWSFGGDFGYGQLTKTMKDGSRESFSMYSVMVSTECHYIRKGIVRLYGTLGLGGTFTSAGSGFAFQFNPIALRVGNDRIAGFAELGVGTKGIVNVGLQVGF